MRTAKDVEAYLERLSRTYSSVEGEEATYLVDSIRGMPPIVVRVDPPIAVFRVHIGDVPPDEPGHLALFRRLLELNAKTLVHTSFGLEDGRIVLTGAAELENLDYNEVQAFLDEMDLTLAEQVPGLAELSKQ